MDNKNTGQEFGVGGLSLNKLSPVCFPNGVQSREVCGSESAFQKASVNVVEKINKLHGSLKCQQNVTKSSMTFLKTPCVGCQCGGPGQEPSANLHGEKALV